MLIRILLFLLEAAAGLLSFAFLARFVLQWARASFRNPLGQFVIAITDWAVKPARRVIPGLWGLDLASLLLAWLVQGMYLGLAYGLLGGPLAPEAIAVVAVQALFALVRIGVWLAIAVVLISAIFSWINPYAPLAPFFNALSAPLLMPFRRVIPPIGGLDLSPIALLLTLQVILMVLDSAQMAVITALLPAQLFPQMLGAPR
ncbi:MAG: YggT family protein [Rhodocyclaceae bacterium]|nr:YggT family protein [Rhodocyclaceae bacterium]